MVSILDSSEKKIFTKNCFSKKKSCTHTACVSLDPNVCPRANFKVALTGPRLMLSHPSWLENAVVPKLLF